jgi:hypothetical protein
MNSAESRSSDADMENSMTALLRAAKRARELARQKRTEYVVMRDGRLVSEIPPLEPELDSDTADTEQQV